MVFPIELPSNSRVLVIGAGGGFDFLCGLPIVLELESRGHYVHMGNYSFTQLQEVAGGIWHTDSLLEINANSTLQSGHYFPELLLAKWWKRQNRSNQSVWCLDRKGVQPTLKSYNYLVEQLNLDAVICIDGGVDGIFRGDEHDLGTPSMDSISVISTSLCQAKHKIYACTAFGTEGAEGKVSHAQALERMADLIAQQAMLGVGVVLPQTKVGQDFLAAVRFAFDQIEPVRRSIIISTLVAAIQGQFGNTSVHAKTQDKPPWLSPLTALFWYFQAEAVAKIKLFYHEVLNTETVKEMADAIERARARHGVKPHQSIPI